MALTNKSLFLYNFTVNSYNNYLDFRASSGGPQLSAQLNYGYYSLTSLALEIQRAMVAADPAHEYTVTVDRTLSGGLQNRMTIATNGTYLDLLFGSGSHLGASISTLIGFNSTDRTGATSYVGNFTCGTSFVSTFVGYNYVPPDFIHKLYGNVNISANGLKEAVVFQIQKFFEVEFRYEPYSSAITNWAPFFDWAIQQRLFEFTPNYTVPNVFYECTLERSSEDGKGLGFKLTEMLPQFPNLWQTGILRMRQNVATQTFI